MLHYAPFRLSTVNKSMLSRDWLGNHVDATEGKPEGQENKKYAKKKYVVDSYLEIEGKTMVHFDFHMVNISVTTQV